MKKFIPGQVISFCEGGGEDAHVCLLQGTKILTMRNGGELPRFRDLNAGANAGIMPKRFLVAGELDGADCIGTILPKEADGEAFTGNGAEWVELRAFFAAAEEAESYAAGRIRVLWNWIRQHKFCGGCGSEPEASRSDISLKCKNCGAMYYPQIAPAVIVAITRGNDEILLAHNVKFRPEVHSLIAGFVEAGENAEQAIRREIMEEVGIEVSNIRYLGSQCWPFPNSLMLGYTAEYAGGTIKPDGTEIQTAGFFRRNAMPVIPSPGSIARKLIDLWIKGEISSIKKQRRGLQK